MNKTKSKKNKNLNIENSFLSHAEMNNEIEIQKPFLKWVGGKTQMLNKLLSKVPKEMNNYHELFLGGGSVLLAVLSLQKQNIIKIKEKIYAYDINSILINVFKNIQSKKDELYKHVDFYINEYDKINGDVINRKPKDISEAKTSKESYYYWLRNKFNTIDKSTVECSALFMVINKLCFRGMYREGPNGFNVPFGNYKTTPTVISKEDLNTISDLIKDVEFKQSSFTDSIKNPKEGDFVYLDPPYAPENEKSFVGYVNDGFNLDMHKCLFDEIKNLSKINVRFVMSNAKVDLVTESLKDFNSEDITARRAINSKNPGSTTTEIFIYN
jgi:DNA adenine methylase